MTIGSNARNIHYFGFLYRLVQLRYLGNFGGRNESKGTVIPYFSVLRLKVISLAYQRLTPWVISLV